MSIKSIIKRNQRRISAQFIKLDLVEQIHFDSRNLNTYEQVRASKLKSQQLSLKKRIRVSRYNKRQRKKYNKKLTTMTLDKISRQKLNNPVIVDL